MNSNVRFNNVRFRNGIILHYTLCVCNVYTVLLKSHFIFHTKFEQRANSFKIRFPFHFCYLVFLVNFIRCSDVRCVMFPFEFGNISISVYDNCSAWFVVFTIILQVGWNTFYGFWNNLQNFSLENDALIFDAPWIGDDLACALKSIHCHGSDNASRMELYLIAINLWYVAHSRPKPQKQFNNSQQIHQFGEHVLCCGDHNIMSINLTCQTDQKKSISFGEMETMLRIKAHTAYTLHFIR